MATGHLAPLVRYIHRIAAAESSAGFPTDSQLLARFVAERDEDAFAALVRRHGPLVLGVLRRVLWDWHAADDAFQAVFMVLARKAPCLRQPQLLGNWLHGVALRTALKARAEALRRRVHERQAAAERPAADFPNDAIILQDLRAILDEEIDRLPTRYRLPVVLCYLQSMTNLEASRLLGCSRGTIATRLARAREL